MNKKISVIKLFASSVLLVASVFVINSCNNDDSETPSPTIASFSPAAGVEGATVIITGANFSATASANVVTFNGTAATVTGATATQITTTVPAGASTGKITVQVGIQTATSTDDFAYLPTIMVNTFAGNSTAGFADGTGTAAQFNNPSGVAVDAAGNLYVADPINHRIRKITSDGVVSTLAGSGTAGFAGGTGTTAEFKTPTGVAVDAAGNVYVGDTYNHRIRKITPSGVVSTLAGSGTAGFAEGTGTAAQFYNPRGVVVDASGNLYVADSYNHRIRKITSDGVVSTLAGSGTGGFAEGAGTAAQFYNPRGVAVDISGNVYVADETNHRIRKITSDGVVSTLAGSGSGGFAEGTGTAAQFYAPMGVAADASGNVYVSDYINHRIRKITPGGVVSTMAGSTSGFADGTTAQFYGPEGVTVDATGNVYVADTMNQRIRKITTQ